MKNLKYIMATLMVALVVAAVFVGCKKEKETGNAPTDNATPAETQAILERINNFKETIAYYQENPVVKDGETESVDDAIWDIEALFNFTYSYPELSYSRTISYDTTLYLPVNDKQVLLTDLTIFYGQMYEAISELYHNTELPDKQFLILDVEEGELHGNTLAVKLHSVQGSVRETPTPPEPPQVWMGPFEEGIRWHFGQTFGGPNGEEGNAATEITEKINQIVSPKAPEGFFYQYVNIITKESLGHLNLNEYGFSHHLFSYENMFCEFCKNNPSLEDEWLNSDMLNFHYWGERELVLNRLPNQEDQVGVVPSTHSFFEIHIEPMHIRQVDGYQKIYHTTIAKYGEKIIVGTNSISRLVL